MSVDAWGTMSRDVFSCIFRRLNLSSKRAMLRVCKRFYWLIKPHLVVSVVPNVGVYKANCACCHGFNIGERVVNKYYSPWRLDKLNKRHIVSVPETPRVECEYGHVFPCHAKDVALYDETTCPKDGCGHLVVSSSKKKRKTK